MTWRNTGGSTRDSADGSNQLSLGLPVCRAFPGVRPHTVSPTPHGYVRLLFCCLHSRAVGGPGSPSNLGVSGLESAGTGWEEGEVELLMVSPYSSQKWPSAVGRASGARVFRALHQQPRKPGPWRRAAGCWEAPTSAVWGTKAFLCNEMLLLGFRLFPVWSSAALLWDAWLCSWAR